MSSKTENKTPVSAEETRSAAPVNTEADREAEDKAFLASIPSPCVYCGPSVRGVVRQFTVFRNGIPNELAAFLLEHRTAKGLCVSVARFAQVRARLETKGTGEYILYHKTRSEII